ncbi:MAG: helix-turn-helix transcriptional regulator [Chitinivibrionales bacterium]|nr:helix-turn-helix transcriptional regulator [Chitinivibrionales bacterium]
MNKAKRAKLQQYGWKTGDAADFLNLSPEETHYLELKVALAQYLQKKRTHKHLTQASLAKMVHSSQSRVAKMEQSDATVSVDLLVRSLFALGTSRTELARVFSQNQFKKAA